jgi:hypothetical protein
MDSVRSIQGSRDQRLFDSFPELIAVFHALHRLLAPRHPPHALSSLAALFLPSATLPDTPKVHRIGCLEAEFDQGTRPHRFATAGLVTIQFSI